MITAIIRADASQNIGGGHVMRCLSLASQLERKGANITFAVRYGSVQTVPLLADSSHDIIVLEGLEHEEAGEIQARIGECDWLVVDHYGRDDIFETRARSFAKKIMVIDDLADRSHDCDLLLDQTYGRVGEDYTTLVPEGSRILTGAGYALLRPEFATLRPQALARREKSRKIQRILVSLGAGDPHGTTARVLQAIASTELDLAVDVVTGTVDPASLGLVDIARAMSQRVNFHDFSADMAQLMARADLAIGAGGSSSWERCCLGLPTLMVVTADNQEKIARELERAGAASFIGQEQNLDVATLRKSLQNMMVDYNAQQYMSQAGAAICDGMGARRVTTMLQKVSAL